MSKRLFSLSAAIALVVSCAGSATGTAGSFTRGCAARDLQVLMLIEERADAKLLSEQALNDAMLTIFQARMVCHDGRVMDAIALYDSVANSIERDPPPMTQGRWDGLSSSAIR
jgi:hypothetical protein